jgi:hypothetical protein
MCLAIAPVAPERPGRLQRIWRPFSANPLRLLALGALAGDRVFSYPSGPVSLVLTGAAAATVIGLGRRAAATPG